MSHERDGPDSVGRHDSDADLGHGRARHGQAGVPGDPVPAQPGLGGDAIANGFVYRGRQVPALEASWCSATSRPAASGTPKRAEVLAADDGNPATVAPIHEIDTGLRRLTEETYRARGGKGAALPGMGAISGRGRVDVRFAVDNDGELYILTKSDGMIRKVVGARDDGAGARCDCARRRVAGQNVRQPASREPEEPRGIDARLDRRRQAGLRHQLRGLSRHLAQGAVNAGMTISIIEEQKGKQPPDLTDDQWDHGSSDGAIAAVIKAGCRRR